MTARRSALATLGVLTLVVALGCEDKGESPPEKQVMLAVAASLRAVQPELAKAFMAKHPKMKIEATYGATGDLKKQVEAGAPIDGVLFASAAPVDELIDKGLVDAGSRRLQAVNTLVLIGPKGTKKVTFQTLEQVAEGEKIAIGEPGAVPAGQYARDALQKLGKWDAVQSRLVFGGDVSAVLAYARRGEVAAAIVYKTETRGIDDIEILDEARGDWAPRAEVVSGVVHDGKAADAAGKFLEFVASDDGKKILADFGFGAP